MTLVRPQFNTARVVVVIVVALVAAAVAVVAWSPWTSSPAAGRLAVSNPNHQVAGNTEPSVKLGENWVYTLGFPVCTQGGPVKVTSVEPNKPSGDLRVTEWSIGRDGKTLGKIGTTSGLVGIHHPTITWGCAGRPPYQLGQVTVTVQLHSPTAIARGFLLHSTAGSVVVPFVVAACTAATCDVGGT